MLLIKVTVIDYFLCYHNCIPYLYFLLFYSYKWYSLKFSTLFVSNRHLRMYFVHNSEYRFAWIQHFCSYIIVKLNHIYSKCLIGIHIMEIETISNFLLISRTNLIYESFRSEYFWIEFSHMLHLSQQFQHSGRSSIYSLIINSSSPAVISETISVLSSSLLSLTLLSLPESSILSVLSRIMTIIWMIRKTFLLLISCYILITPGQAVLSYEPQISKSLTPYMLFIIMLSETIYG